MQSDGQGQVVEICNFYGPGFGPKDSAFPCYVGEYCTDTEEIFWEEV